MGAWGYGPFESDQALDWVGEAVTAPLLETLQRAVLCLADVPTEDLGGEHDRLTAAQSAIFVFTSLIGHPSRALDISADTAKDFATEAIKLLNRINASTFPAEWDDPVKYQGENLRLIARLGVIQKDPSRATVGTTLLTTIVDGETQRLNAQDQFVAHLARSLAISVAGYGDATTAAMWLPEARQIVERFGFPMGSGRGLVRHDAGYVARKLNLHWPVGVDVTFLTYNQSYIIVVQEPGDDASILTPDAYRERFPAPAEGDSSTPADGGVIMDAEEGAL